LNRQLETLQTLKTKLEQIENGNVHLIEAQIVKIEQDINKLGSIRDQDAHDLLHDEDQEMLKWLYYSSIANIKRLAEPKYIPLHEILSIENEEDRVTQFNKYLKDDKNLSIFLKVFPFVITTNQSSVRLGSASPHFDLVIIDEAGQCSITNSLLPMLRGDRLLLVGDQNQLEPVIVLDPNINARLMKQYRIQENYNYMNNSILKLMQSVDYVSKYILMRFHYRSHRKIIDFSNKKYYQNQLIIETKMKDDNALYFVDVKSESYHPKKNTSLSEIDAIIKIITEQKYQNVGIISPFRNQSALIEENCKANGIENIDVGTIHTFQGDEKDIIFISTAITPQSGDKTYDWIKHNRELINVATTRPKEKLFIVGDYQEILRRSSDQDDYLSLIEYVKSNGINDILPKPDDQYRVLVDGRKKINTHNESDFIETIAHYMTTDKRYSVVPKVKVSSALKYADDEDKAYFHQAEFDFILENKITGLPELVIELDGPEHYLDPVVKAKDRRKERICQLNGISMLRIKNENIREYEFVRNEVLKILG
jgi:superfamily I DNA and/or RNA helicase